VIQLREKQRSDRDVVAAARTLRKLTEGTDTTLIVNDRPDIARIVSADGVHVGQDELSVADARSIVGPDPLVGVSTHSMEQARQAVIDGADYIGVGPVFASRTKSFEEFVGLDLVRDVVSEIGIPVFPIGGITIDRVKGLRTVGATRVAVSSEIWLAEDPASAAVQFRSQLK
jgi:thiamine-phosphate pyrophosphorylase